MIKVVILGDAEKAQNEMIKRFIPAIVIKQLGKSVIMKTSDIFKETIKKWYEENDSICLGYGIYKNTEEIFWKF